MDNRLEKEEALSAFKHVNDTLQRRGPHMNFVEANRIRRGKFCPA